MKKEILLYGATWCPDCRRSKAYLNSKQVSYTYIDLDTDESAAAKVEEINHGLQSIPTIVFPSGKVLVEPSNQVLQAALDEAGTHAD